MLASVISTKYKITEVWFRSENGNAMAVHDILLYFGLCSQGTRRCSPYHPLLMTQMLKQTYCEEPGPSSTCSCTEGRPGMSQRKYCDEGDSSEQAKDSDNWNHRISFSGESSPLYSLLGIWFPHNLELLTGNARVCRCHPPQKGQIPPKAS